MPSTPKPRGIGLATALLLFQVGAASAVELPEAVRAWFATDRSIVCFDPDGNDRRCAMDADTHLELRRSPDASTALAFVTYLPDPTGNATVTTAAIFQAGERGWRHVRTLPEVRGALAGKVTFGERTATFAVAVPRQGDSHCCPTGRKTYRVALPRETPEAVGGKPDASASRQAALDPARVIAEQMRLEKRGDRTGLFSKSLKAAYDAVPKDEPNVGLTILGSGYDVPREVLGTSAPQYDVADPKRASVTATLHYTNEDAPVPSFDRSIVVVFIAEDGHWKIDDVHYLDPKGRRPPREVGMKRAFGLLTEERARRTTVERHVPAPRAARNEMPDNRRSAP